MCDCCSGCWIVFRLFRGAIQLEQEKLIVDELDRRYPIEEVSPEHEDVICPPDKRNTAGNEAEIQRKDIGVSEDCERFAADGNPRATGKPPPLEHGHKAVDCAIVGSPTEQSCAKPVGVDRRVVVSDIGLGHAPVALRQGLCRVAHVLVGRAKVAETPARRRSGQTAREDSWREQFVGAFGYLSGKRSRDHQVRRTQQDEPTKLSCCLRIRKELDPVVTSCSETP